MIKLKAFNHAAFRVSDVEKATSFYEKVVGLKRIPRPNFGFGGAWYGIGDDAMHLISSENRGSKPDPLGPHIAFEVEDFEEAKRELKAMGIEFLEGAGKHGRAASSGSSIPTATPWSCEPRSNRAPRSK